MTNEQIESLIGDLELPIDVTGISVEDYVDCAGDDAIRVTVELASSVNVRRVSGERVAKMKQDIRETLLRNGVEKFPYIWVSQKAGA